jgi:hypothetical protein
MARKKATRRKANPGGFWDRSDKDPAIVSVRNPGSRLARAAGFLLRLIGLGRRNP